MQTIMIGLDIAKSVFQVHGVDGNGAVFRKRLPRSKLMIFFAQLEPCLIGMEACATAHHWARELTSVGHKVKLMPPAYVKAYVKRGKNDAIDAEAIVEALGRPTMRFVAIKSRESQAVLVTHKVREQLVRERTKLVNVLRAHMAEFGVIAPQGIWRIAELKKIVANEADERLPELARAALKPVLRQLDGLDSAITELECRIVRHARGGEAAKRLAAIPGVGPIGASAFAASVADAGNFKSARHFAAWLGLTPKQNASGLKDRSGRISRMGNAYLRTLLVLGATSVVRRAQRAKTPLHALATRLLGKRKSARLVTVALANKMARVIWALLARDECYRPA